MMITDKDYYFLLWYLKLKTVAFKLNLKLKHLLSNLKRGKRPRSQRLFLKYCLTKS